MANYVVHLFINDIIPSHNATRPMWTKMGDNKGAQENVAKKKKMIAKMVKKMQAGGKLYP